MSRGHEERLAELGIELPSLSKPVANYLSCKRSGDLLFVGGHGPASASGVVRGKVGGSISAQEGREAARLTALSLLATVRDALGTLDRVRQVVKVFGMVNCAPGFNRTPEVIDGCSDLLVAVFGDARTAHPVGCRHGRAAVRHRGRDRADPRGRLRWRARGATRRHERARPPAGAFSRPLRRRGPSLPRARPRQSDRRAHRLQRRASCCPRRSTCDAWVAAAPRGDRTVRLYAADLDAWSEFSTRRSDAATGAQLDRLSARRGAGARACRAPPARRGRAARERGADRRGPELVGGARGGDRLARCSTSPTSPPIRSRWRASASAPRTTSSARAAASWTSSRRATDGRAARCCSTAARSRRAASRCPAELAILVCDSMVKHALAGGAYNRRRAECEAGVRILARSLPGIRALRDVGRDDLEARRAELPDDVYRRCRHVIAENARVHATVAALEAAISAGVGRLLCASHASLRDDYEVELSRARHAGRDRARAVRGLWQPHDGRRLRRRDDHPRTTRCGRRADGRAGRAL